MSKPLHAAPRRPRPPQPNRKRLAQSTQHQQRNTAYDSGIPSPGAHPTAHGQQEQYDDDDCNEQFSLQHWTEHESPSGMASYNADNAADGSAAAHANASSSHAPMARHDYEHAVPKRIGDGAWGDGNVGSNAADQVPQRQMPPAAPPRPAAAGPHRKPQRDLPGTSAAAALPGPSRSVQPEAAAALRVAARALSLRPSKLQEKAAPAASRSPNKSPQALRRSAAGRPFNPAARTSASRPPTGVSPGSQLGPQALRDALAFLEHMQRSGREIERRWFGDGLADGRQQLVPALPAAGSPAKQRPAASRGLELAAAGRPPPSAERGGGGGADSISDDSLRRVLVGRKAFLRHQQLADNGSYEGLQVSPQLHVAVVEALADDLLAEILEENAQETWGMCDDVVDQLFDLEFADP